MAGLQALSAFRCCAAPLIIENYSSTILLIFSLCSLNFRRLLKSPSRQSAYCHCEGDFAEPNFSKCSSFKGFGTFSCCFSSPFFFFLIFFFFSICARLCMCVCAFLTLHPIPFLLHSIHGTPQYRVSSFLLPWHPASWTWAEDVRERLPELWGSLSTITRSPWKPRQGGQEHLSSQ